MSKASNRTYHEGRAREELKRAEEALDPAIARVHLELAALHRAKLAQLGGESGLKRQAAIQPWALV